MTATTDSTTHGSPATPTTLEGGSATTDRPRRTVTIREAAELTGTTHGSIRGRVERGTLRCVLQDGKRRIPLSELERAGLLGASAGSADDHAMSTNRGSNAVAVAGATESDHAWQDVVTRLDTLYRENAALTERAVVAETRLQIAEKGESTLQEEFHRMRLELEAAAEREGELQRIASAELEAMRSELERLQRKRGGWFRRSKVRS